MTDNQELIRLDQVQLTSGSHTSPEGGMCLLEAVAYVAGEKHSDHPVCASPVLGTFGRSLNDTLPDDLRQQLKPLVPLLIGTSGDGHDEARSYLALDWLIRTYLLTWLEVGGVDEHAAVVRELPAIVDLDTARTAGPMVRAAQAAAKTAGWAATEAAGWAAAGAAGWAAAEDAAWAAAKTAGWAAAQDAAEDAAGAAAEDAVAATVLAAARAAARAAAGAAGWAAAGDALAPTVRELQLSAIELFGRMISVNGGERGRGTNVGTDRVKIAVG